MIIWGGFNGGGLNSGGGYCAQAVSSIALSASGRKVAGINTARLTWSGATSANIDIYRDALAIATVPNTGSHIDSTGDTGQARYTYRVCEAGTRTCSDKARVTFRR